MEKNLYCERGEGWTKTISMKKSNNNNKTQIAHEGLAHMVSRLKTHCSTMVKEKYKKKKKNGAIRFDAVKFLSKTI